MKNLQEHKGSLVLPIRVDEINRRIDIHRDPSKNLSNHFLSINQSTGPNALKEPKMNSIALRNQKIWQTNSIYLINQNMSFFYVFNK